MPTDADREFVEKLRTIGHISGYKPGATRTVEVKREDDGTKAGEHIEHYDGSQDAVAMPRTIKLKMTQED